jgi:hypothetical protein
LPSQTRSSLSTLTSLLIDDTSNQAFTAAQVLAKIEEAQERFVLDTRVLRDVATGSSVSRQQEYALPSDFMDVIRLSIDGAELTRVSKADLHFIFRGTRWDQTYGTPSHYYVDLDPNNQKYGLYPIPTGSGSSDISIEYVKMPPVLSSDSSVPFDGHTLLIPYHNSLAYWAAKELLMIRPSQENLVRIQQYTKRYEDEVSNCIETFKHLEQSQGLRFKGGRHHKGL